MSVNLVQFYSARMKCKKLAQDARKHEIYYLFKTENFDRKIDLIREAFMQ